MISTRDLRELPEPATLSRLMQSMATLDAILESEWQYRYYSFNSKWSPGEQMGSMRDGSGNDIFCLFDSAGCFIKGFAHESRMSPYRTSPPRVWPGVLDHVPVQFSKSLNEPAFTMADTTFCIWRGPADQTWHIGPVEFPNEHDPDGSGMLLFAYDGSPETYRAWAEQYYERDIDPQSVAAIFQHEPLTPGLVSALRSSRSLSELSADTSEIGYPSGAAA